MRSPKDFESSLPLCSKQSNNERVIAQKLTLFLFYECRMNTLLKPFNYQDFLHAADKARLQHELFSRPLNRSEEGENPDSLFVKADYKMIRIDFRDILYIEGQSEYARIFRENQPPVMTLLSLKAIEERLPTNRFMRVHRSYIVHLDKVKEVARNRIIFAPDTYIPVGDQYKDNFNRFLDTNSLIKK